MAEKIAFENERISNFKGLLTLTLDRVILHIIMHQSSTSTYMPNFIKIEETLCGRRPRHQTEIVNGAHLGAWARIAYTRTMC